MKTTILISIAFFFTIGATAQSKIIAQMSNIRNNRGVCRVCLFNNAAAFDGDKGVPVQCLTAFVKNGTAETVFENIAAGTYAIAVFHDANNNKQMDKNIFGIPKEGYGASRNKLPFASAPGFAENRFTIPDKTITTLQIRLRNL
ncbi:MAG TPA: DUF2141 domain-containing protein [Chitinophagaceae bacterium]|nr:DUF2141 domain-containing protein [Chitinophagaceae bacterium]